MTYFYPMSIRNSTLGLVIIFVLIVASCQSPPERNCVNFKSGEFNFISILNKDTLQTKAIRKKDIEIEYFEGNPDTSSIRWINECEYVLKKLNPKNRAEEKSIHIKILTTTDSSYTFEFSAIGETRKLRGTAFKTH